MLLIRRGVTPQLLLIVSVTLGCGGSGLPTTGIVTGVVTIGGEPQGKISVLFLPEGGDGSVRPASSGITDEDGRYTLRYAIQNDSDPGNPTVGDGAVLGTHRVTVSDYRMANERLRPPGRVPLRYTSVDTTPLSFDVIPGEQIMDIALPKQSSSAR